MKDLSAVVSCDLHTLDYFCGPLNCHDDNYDDTYTGTNDDDEDILG